MGRQVCTSFCCKYCTAMLHKRTKKRTAKTDAHLASHIELIFRHADKNRCFLKTKGYFQKQSHNYEDMPALKSKVSSHRFSANATKISQGFLKTNMVLKGPFGTFE